MQSASNFAELYKRNAMEIKGQWLDQILQLYLLQLEYLVAL